MKQRSLAARVQERILRRRDAVKRWKQSPYLAPELTIVRCRDCGRAIATTKVDQEKGEPPVLLELRDEHEPHRVQCTECGSCRCCGSFLGRNEGDGATFCARCLGHIEQGEELCFAEHMSPLSRRRQEIKAGIRVPKPKNTSEVVESPNERLATPHSQE